MPSVYKKLLLLFTFVGLFHCGFSQSKEIKIQFIGNCGLYMTDGMSDLYIDFPYKSGAHNYMEYDESEIDRIKDQAIFIFTHRHADHYSEKILKKLSGQKFDPWNAEELEKLGKSIPGFDVKAFRTEHKVFGISFRHYSYLITWHNRKIFISGDTENAATIATQKDLDWAFVPAWIFADAEEKGIKLKSISKMYAVYHIGPADKITSNGTDPQIKLLDRQGEIISVPY
jgi:hypothetical protein